MDAISTPYALRRKVVITVAGDSDTGKRRRENQDVWEWLETQFFVALDEDEPTLLPTTIAIVADGMGGEKGGRQAAELAAKTVGEALRYPRPQPALERLESAIQRANEAVLRASRQDLRLQGMGTTVVVAAVVDNHLYLAHVGDSRAYLVRGEHLHLLTVDHTRVQEMVDRGELTPAEAAVHPNRHVLAQHVGRAAGVRVGLEMILPGNDASQAAHATSLLLQPGDIVLLCTDGLTDEPTHDELLTAILRSRGDMALAASRLVQLANDRGGSDNSTAVLLKVDEERAGPERRWPALLLPLTLTAFAFFLLGYGARTYQETILQRTTAALVAQATTPRPPSATPTLRDTATPTSPPTPNPGVIVTSETPQSADEPTSTVIPASTLTPTRALSPSPSPRRQPATTPTPVPPATPTVPPSPATATTAPSAIPTDTPTPVGSITLVEPAPDAAIKSPSVRFRVRVEGLGPGQRMGLVLRREDAMNETQPVRLALQLDNAEYVKDVENPPQDYGRYSWMVEIMTENGALVQGSPQQTFEWQSPTEPSQEATNP